ncbi:MAG: YjbQ family protein [Rhodospirillaceae bacterium]|nr:YjbQ family protein [Rhodospirillaceae bacterium]MBT4218410.1 YjbQ family protein [Rhodospirillaceae bacterium]MBT4464437.1 YjbQ family protein [Rhodospirillaceae bacterium]MBT5014449.1 YjbQ family protein [Rhodospirillaceae bacterium]MBT5308389.1 YjbQ family protein [Rhodospirillaceae bacterium]
MRQAEQTVAVETGGRGLYEFTGAVRDWVGAQGISTGLLTVFCRHTSASLTIQENADSDVMADLETFFSRLVLEDPSLYRHTMEGPDDMPAHIRSALTDVSLSIPLSNGQPALGTWQGIYLFEHRKASHTRQVSLHLIGT